jgi:SAM-dependent methyltransferase
MQHTIPPANDPQRMAAYYDQLAPVYGEGELFRARRASVLAAIAAELAKARTVLDLGCGNGSYAADIVSRAPSARIVGADLSVEMVRAAHRRLGARAPVVRAAATALPFRAACFDVVFMSHVLQLVDDIGRCAAEVTAALTPGGWWITTIGVSGWRQAVLPLLGAEALQELAALFAVGRERAPADDEQRAAAACADVGLQPSWRRPSFSVSWPAVEEWLRLRWFVVADAAVRARAERWLGRVRPRVLEQTFTITETVLVARKG